MILTDNKFITNSALASMVLPVATLSTSAELINASSEFISGFSWIAAEANVRSSSVSDKLVQQLIEFEKLEEGWDADDGARISDEAINSARRFLANHQSDISPVLSPNASGTVAIEWKTNLGEAALEIGKTKFSFYLITQTQEPAFKDGTLDDLLQSAGKSICELIDTKLYPTINVFHRNTGFKNSPRFLVTQIARTNTNHPSFS